MSRKVQFSRGKMEFFVEEVNKLKYYFYRIKLFHLNMCCKVHFHSDNPPADLKLTFKGQGQGQKCKKMV